MTNPSRAAVPELTRGHTKSPRPDSRFLSNPTPADTELADLGYWNWVDPATAVERAEGEREKDFLERMAGAFRTPTLRNLPRTGPYMHNGAYDSIEATVREIVRINELARADMLRNIDADYRVMNLSQDDVPQLTAFLASIDEVDDETFRELLLNFEE